ncbi:MAG: ABC transporter transmembrane domain-containing protein, partial [Candidatus Zixiibacteriota bacterium]
MRDKIKWLWQYYRRYPYVLTVLIALTPVQTILQITIPRLIQFAIDYVETGQVSSNMAALLIGVIGRFIGLSTPGVLMLAFILVGFGAAVLYAFIQSHRAWMNLRLEWLFRQEAFDGITFKGPDFFNRFRTGDLVTRMTDDVAEKLSWCACSGIFRFYEAL